MKLATLLISLLTFGTFVWAILCQFKSTRTPAGMKALSLIGGVCFAAYLWSLGDHQSDLRLAVGCGAQGVSLMLFRWGITTGGDRRLNIAFDPNPSDFILRTGPYRFLRHPLYASYALFWIGVAWVGNWWFLDLLVIVLIGIYVGLAKAEERRFARSALKDDYVEYKRQAGFFWPKLPQLIAFQK